MTLTGLRTNNSMSCIAAPRYRSLASETGCVGDAGVAAGGGAITRWICTSCPGRSRSLPCTTTNWPGCDRARHVDPTTVGNAQLDRHGRAFALLSIGRGEIDDEHDRLRPAQHQRILRHQIGNLLVAGGQHHSGVHARFDERPLVGQFVLDADFDRKRPRLHVRLRHHRRSPRR